MKHRFSANATAHAALAAVAAALVGVLAFSSAHAGSLIVRDNDGSQWTVNENPTEDAEDYLLKRLLPDRKPDPRFARNGAAAFILGSDNDAPTSVRVDSTRRIWMVGSSLSGNQPQPVVARFAADGNVDPRWGVQGKLQTSPNGTALRPNDVLPLSDGSALVAGETPAQGTPRAIVYHLKADGTLDTGFGTGGLWQRNGTEASSAMSLAVGPEGTIAVAISVRGPKPGAEVWSLSGGPPSLISRETLDESADEDELRATWNGSRWTVSASAGPTAVVPPASLDAHASAPVAAATPAPTSAPSDAGQGGFNPFAAQPPAAAAPGTLAEGDDGMAWIGILAAVALATAIGAVLFRSKRRARGPTVRQPARR